MRSTALGVRGELPHVVHASAGARDLPAFLNVNRSLLAAQLLESGALLLRGFDVLTMEQFDAAVAAISTERLDYGYGSTPRTELSRRIYTTTEYPPTQTIPLHCENAYQRRWPLKLVFGCLTPASVGGETPIADVRRVTARLGEHRVDEFERKGVRYVRHYRPHLDVPWQRVFQVADRQALAEVCARSNISHSWLDQETLRTSQVCQGTARHPLTGERLWFNQAHLFQSSSLGAQMERALVKLYGRDRLPRQAFFGDGSEISQSDLLAARQAFEDEAVTFEWQRADVLLIDNMRVAHGRQPFKGERKVVAALLEQAVAAEDRCDSPAQRLPA